MPAKRKRVYEDWELIHRALGDLMNEFQAVRVHRRGIIMNYFGTRKRLRGICTRIINVLDRMEGKDEAGIFAKARGQKVSFDGPLDSSGNSYRADDREGNNSGVRSDDNGPSGSFSGS